MSIRNARGFRRSTLAADEIQRKAQAIAALAAAEGLAGIVVSAVHNFAWLTGGGTNRVDFTRETGVAHLLVGADGRRWILASNIEADRMRSEVVAGLGFETVVYPWQDDRSDPAFISVLAARLLGGTDIGADTGLPGTRNVEATIGGLRARLDPADLERYRQLGSDTARLVGSLASALQPGVSERVVADRLQHALLGERIRAAVILVGGDERIARYRHPVPTETRWRKRLLIAVCAERNGLIVALSRLVASDADADLTARTRACAGVFARMVDATIPGASAAEIYRAAADAYTSAGYPHEERLHHQGGAIAYRAREWVAHPSAAQRVTAPQAFAWNPSITGTKVEETIVVHDDGVFDVVTHDPSWPAETFHVRGLALRVPVARVIGA